MTVQGLYVMSKQGVDSMLTPLRAEPLVVKGVPRGNPRSRVDTSPLAIIHLRLGSLPAYGTVTGIVYESLKAYFGEGRRLLYHEVTFMIKTARDIAPHQRRMRDMLETIAK